MYTKMSIIVGSFIVADIATGVIASVKNGEFNSSTMRSGLWAKIGEVAAALLAALCEWALPIVGVSIDLPLFSGVCTYLALMELGSCIENITKISPELKTMLARYLGIYRNED